MFLGTKTETAFVKSRKEAKNVTAQTKGVKSLREEKHIK